MKGAIAVIDKDPGYRDRVKLLLQRKGYRVDGLASVQALSALSAPPDCLLFSVGGRQSGAFEYLRKARNAPARMPVIIVARDADVDLALLAGQLGAADFLVKPLASRRLQKAISTIMQQTEAAAETGHTRAALEARYFALTDRQRETMQFLLQGLGNKEIAAKLDISPRTVEIYRAGVMARMEADSLVHLVRIGIELGIE